MNRKLLKLRPLALIIPMILLAVACNFANLPANVPELTTTEPETPATSPPPASNGETQPTPTNPPIVETSGNLDIIASGDLLVDLYNTVSPGVVSIQVFTRLGGGQGSGFVYDLDGHIVTNHHVIEGAESIEVTFFDGSKAYATLIGFDVTADLAVIKVEVENDLLYPVTLGDSEAIQVGQPVVAIGNPFGLDSTMTLGIVSGLGRSLTGEAAPGGGNFSAPDIIQTDAAINPGNSGGPLFNLQGQVVGVNRAIATTSGLNSGIGFAVASNTASRIVPSLIENGRHQYSYLGLSGTDSSRLTLRQMEALNLPATLGVYVVTIVPGGPADQAGIQGDSGTTGGAFVGDGDFITAIDGRQIRNFDEVLSYLVNYTSPGQTITLTLIRDGETLEVPIELGVRP